MVLYDYATNILPNETYNGTVFWKYDGDMFVDVKYALPAFVVKDIVDEVLRLRGHDDSIVAELIEE